MSSIAEELKNISLVDAEKKVKENIARNMLRKGTEIDFIVEVTGLLQEEVERLAEEVQTESK